jgi:hypothetical protein
VYREFVRSLSSLTTPSAILMEVEKHVRVAMVFGSRRNAVEEDKPRKLKADTYYILNNNEELRLHSGKGSGMG